MVARRGEEVSRRRPSSFPNRRGIAIADPLCSIFHEPPNRPDEPGRAAPPPDVPIDPHRDETTVMMTHWQGWLYVAAVLIPLAAFVVEVLFIRILKRFNAYLATGAIATPSFRPQHHPA